MKFGGSLRLSIPTTLLAWALLTGSCSLLQKSSDTLPDDYLATKQDSLSYALGVVNGHAFKQSISRMPGNSNLKKDVLLRGFRTAYDGGTLLISHEEAEKMLLDYVKGDTEARKKRRQFIADSLTNVHAAMKGVQKTKSGLQYVILKEGTGMAPTLQKVVRIHYRGLIAADGKEFDNSYKRMQPLVTPLMELLPALTEGVMLMKPGAKYQFFLPYAIAYGEYGAGDIPPYANLIMEVELLEVLDKMPEKIPAETPESVTEQEVVSSEKSNQERNINNNTKSNLTSLK